jgi:hypothetical protein
LPITSAKRNSSALPRRGTMATANKAIRQKRNLCADLRMRGFPIGYCCRSLIEIISLINWSILDAGRGSRAMKIASKDRDPKQIARPIDNVGR